MNIFCKRKKQNLWKTFLFYTRVLYLNLYLHVYFNKIHIKNGKYVVFTMSWPDDSHPTWLKFYLKSVELKYLFFEDLWNDNTHIRCASLQISQEEWYLCNPVIFPFRGHKFILSLTLLYPMIYDDLIWYQNWYIVSRPLILTGQWSSCLQLYCAGFFYHYMYLSEQSDWWRGDGGTHQIGKGVMGVLIRLVKGWWGYPSDW